MAKRRYYRIRQKYTIIEHVEVGVDADSEPEAMEKVYNKDFAERLAVYREQVGDVEAADIVRLDDNAALPPLELFDYADEKDKENDDG